MTSLKAGDIVWVDFDPVRGTEQGGHRPAVILSDEAFNSRDKRSIVCPITRNTSPWPTKVLLPAGMKTRGAVLVDQIRNVYRDGRGFRYIETAPTEVLQQVRDVIGELLRISR